MPSTVSLGTGRRWEMERRMDCCPDFAEALSQNTAKIRNPREALLKLGLASHPRVAPLCHILRSEETGQRRPFQHHSFLWPGLRDIVYRLTGEDQYRSTAEVTSAQTAMLKETAKLRTKCQQIKQPQRQASRAANVHELMCFHLLEECHRQGTGFMLSICASTRPDSDMQISLTSLEDHLGTAMGDKVLQIPVARRPMGMYGLNVAWIGRRCVLSLVRE